MNGRRRGIIAAGTYLGVCAIAVTSALAMPDGDEFLFYLALSGLALAVLTFPWGILAFVVEAPKIGTLSVQVPLAILINAVLLYLFFGGWRHRSSRLGESR